VTSWCFAVLSSGGSGGAGPPAAALHGLTELQIRVLRYLYRSGPTPIGVLADYLANDPSTLATFVGRLEQREYVERRNDPDDRRVKRIALTESGERIVEDLRDFLAEVAPVSKLTMTQLRQLRTLLADINLAVPGQPPESIHPPV
jgi:DNA-binding MarR family transcriptional regulator